MAHLSRTAASHDLRRTLVLGPPLRFESNEDAFALTYLVEIFLPLSDQGR